MSLRRKSNVSFVVADTKPGKGVPNFGITGPNEFTEDNRNGTKLVRKNHSSMRKTSIRLIPSASLELANIANANNEVTSASSTMLLSPCRYRNSGCKELVSRGTRSEQEHLECCDYRPIRCILHTTCEQLVPYHDFIFHLTKHFLQPNYTPDLTSIVMLQSRDFETDTFWSPKWIAAHGHQFFLMLKRRKDGIWASWVCMFGTEAESKAFQAKISYFRAKRFISGTFPVHSIRKPESAIEAKKTCVMFTDQTMKSVSGIGASLVSDIYVNVQILLNCELCARAPTVTVPVEIPEPIEPAPEPEPEPEPELELEDEDDSEPLVESTALGTLTAFFDKVKAAFTPDEVEADPNGNAMEAEPAVSESSTFLSEPIEHVAIETGAGEAFSPEPVAAASSDPVSDNTSADDESFAAVEAVISETQVEGSESNGTLGFGSTFGNMSLMDLDPTWYLGESMNLFDRISTRLNDLRLQLHASLENSFGSSGEGSDELTVETDPDADVPPNTEVPSNMSPRELRNQLREFELALEVD